MSPLYKLNIKRLLEEREPIVDKCMAHTDEDGTKIKNSCRRIDGKLCSATVSPKTRWRLGPCNIATHVVTIVSENQGKKRVGQQKHRRRRG